MTNLVRPQFCLTTQMNLHDYQNLAPRLYWRCTGWIRRIQHRKWTVPKLQPAEPSQASLVSLHFRGWFLCSHSDLCPHPLFASKNIYFLGKRNTYNTYNDQFDRVNIFHFKNSREADVLSMHFVNSWSTPPPPQFASEFALRCKSFSASAQKPFNAEKVSELLQFFARLKFTFLVSCSACSTIYKGQVVRLVEILQNRRDKTCLSQTRDNKGQYLVSLHVDSVSSVRWLEELEKIRDNQGARIVHFYLRRSRQV